jgi:hypothetical protein
MTDNHEPHAGQLDDGAALLGAAENYEDMQASVERELDRDRNFAQIAKLPELEHV